jgi:hypothetical protein
MKVKELIEQLKKYDEDLPVCISELEIGDSMDGWMEIHDEISLIQKKEEHYNNDIGNEVFGKFVSLIC